MRLNPLSEAIGVEVLDLDPAAELSDAEAEELRRALDEHQLLLFRDARLSDDAHIKLVETFGGVADEHLDGERISWVSNKRKGKGAAPGENKLFWHSDYTFTPWPLTAISLAAFEISGAVAPTRFASAKRAWAALPDALKERFASMRALHMANFSGETADFGLQKDRPEAELDSDLYPHAWHPLVRTHPRTGEPLLFANEYLTIRIDEVGAEQNSALLAQMWDTLYDEDFTYAHQWREGDLLIWDNIALQHGRDDFTPPPGTEPPVRTLRRIVVSDHYPQILDSVPRLKAAMTFGNDVEGFQG